MSTCASCRWFLPTDAITLDPRAPHGECRRHPPTRTDLLTQHGPVAVCGFATTRRSNFCGEWSATPAESAP